jgi:general secretion pathway protein B
MSLILEALRKSEAERQRGRAPGLFVEQARAPARSRSVPAWAWGLAALLVLVLVAWGWREWERAGLASEVATPLPAPAAVGAVPAPQLAEAALQSTDVAPMSAAPIAVAPAPPQPAPPPPATASAPAAPAPFASSPPAPAAPLPPAVARSEAIGAPPPAPVAEAPDVVPSLSSLGANERARLPPLKLSMHVFAESPAQRFVILDGQRLGEGASPASGLVVQEIRRDGLVLAVDGQRFLLPRP